MQKHNTSGFHKMQKYLSFFIITFLLVFMIHNLHSQELNLLPKYGSIKKSEIQIEIDKKFIASIDETYKGNRKQAADDLALRGWDYLRQGNPEDAMRRFNQAWLLDTTNGTALWGMAAIQTDIGKYDEALKLFAEAQGLIKNNINFSVDYARATGLIATIKRDDILLKDALKRFEEVFKIAPQHTLNLKNWAKTLYDIGKYSEAWEKIKLAEATPDKNSLDERFIKDLENKMPRP